MNAPEPPRRPNRRSRLKTLPEDKQRQIIEWLKSPAGGPGTVDLILANFGLETSDTALSEFWSWWHLQQRFSANEARVESILERLAEKRPELPQEQLFSLGQEIFSALAIETQDSESWARVQKLRLSQQQQALEERRIQVLEKKAAEADKAREVMATELTPEQKQSRLREIFGMA